MTYAIERLFDNIHNEGREEGRAKGREEGRAKGREEGKIEIAKEMILDGERNEKIKRYTKLDDAIIDALRKELAN